MDSGTVTLLHISDIHVGSSLFSNELAENVVRLSRELKPDIIVVTGDITDEGLVHEYKKAVEYLSMLECKRMLVVPGNHDSRNAGWVVFERIFGTRFPFLEYNGVCIQGVDSSEPDIDDGHIGRLAYGLVSRNLSKCKDGVRIVALHHHLIPVPGTGRERNIPVDAGDFINLLLELGVHMVLAGHKHVPWLWQLNGMVIAHAGTATTLRLKAGIPPTVNVIHVGDEIEVLRVNVETLSERLVYRGRPEPMKPVQPTPDQEGYASILEALAEKLKQKIPPGVSTDTA